MGAFASWTVVPPCPGASMAWFLLAETYGPHAELPERLVPPWVASCGVGLIGGRLEREALSLACGWVERHAAMSRRRAEG